MSSTLGTKISRPHQQHQPYQQQYQHPLSPIRRISFSLQVKNETPLGRAGFITAAGGEISATKGWWADPDKLSTLDPAKRAFEEAIQIFNGSLADGEGERLDPKEVTTMADVLEYTNKAKESWEGKPRWKKPRKWLERFSSRVTYYGKIMDVLVQHHPEYGSLAWGAMKLLFVLVINHETAVKEVAKTLTRIGCCLPQVNLLSILYPSDEMRNAVATLYAHILSFLQRATSWYRCGRIAHIFRAWWKPFQISFGDLVDDICEQGKRVTELADAGHKLETRAVRGLLESLCERVELLGTVMEAGKETDTRKCMLGRSIRVTQDKFFELQSRFVASKRDQKQLCQVMFGKLRPCLGYKSPGFENLKISGFLGLPIELDFRGLPKALGRLAVELKDTTAVFTHQIAFIFCSNETVREYLKSPADIAKLLVFHVLEHNPHLLLEQKGMLPMDRLQTAQTVTDFLAILEDILRFIPSILFIIDSISSPANSTVPEGKAEGISNDIHHLIKSLNKLGRTFENSVKILFTARPLGKHFTTTATTTATTSSPFEKHTNKLRLDGGMVDWMEGERGFPLPGFRSHTSITNARAVPLEPSGYEAFLEMTTPEGGYISAGTPNRFSLLKRPSWPDNPYSIVRHGCEFRECYDRCTMERTLMTAKFPQPFDVR